MRLFNDIIKELRDCTGGIASSAPVSSKNADSIQPWPRAEKGEIVLKGDTGVELGNPANESVSFLVWSGDREFVRDKTITLIGPDLAESTGKGLPFGKVVILGVSGFNEENCYERHREIDLLRYDMTLKGYMMRAVSQYQREWSRVSKEALAAGASLFSFGKSLVDLYTKVDYIDTAEIVFVTSSAEDVRRLRPIGERAGRLISAMNKMIEEMTFDCGSCDYTDICGEVEDLKTIRKSLIDRK